MENMSKEEMIREIELMFADAVEHQHFDKTLWANGLSELDRKSGYEVSVLTDVMVAIGFSNTEIQQRYEKAEAAGKDKGEGFVKLIKKAHRRP